MSQRERAIFHLPLQVGRMRHRLLLEITSQAIIQQSVLIVSGRSLSLLGECSWYRTSVHSHAGFALRLSRMLKVSVYTRVPTPNRPSNVVTVIRHFHIKEILQYTWHGMRTGLSQIKHTVKIECIRAVSVIRHSKSRWSWSNIRINITQRKCLIDALIVRGNLNVKVPWKDTLTNGIQGIHHTDVRRVTWALGVVLISRFTQKRNMLQWRFTNVANVIWHSDTDVILNFTTVTRMVSMVHWNANIAFEHLFMRDLLGTIWRCTQ